MSTIVTRKGAKFWFGIDLPKHIIYMHRNYPNQDWQYYTTYDVLEKKRVRNSCNLQRKRIHETIKPCFVWVFFNTSWIFHGWYVNITTIVFDKTINFREDSSFKEKFISKIMSLFPCGIIPVQANFEIWAENFASIYPNTTFYGGRKQGLKSCHCRIDEYGKLIDVFK